MKKIIDHMLEHSLEPANVSLVPLEARQFFKERLTMPLVKAEELSKGVWILHAPYGLTLVCTYLEGTTLQDYKNWGIA